MKNLVKLLTLSFFAMFAASDIEASTYGHLNTYDYGGVSTTIGSIGSSNVYLNTYDYGGISTSPMRSRYANFKIIPVIRLPFIPYCIFMNIINKRIFDRCIGYTLIP